MRMYETFKKSATFFAVFAGMLGGGFAAAQPVTEKWWGPPPIGAKWESAQKNTGSFGSDRQMKMTRLPDATWKGAPVIAVGNAGGGTMLMRQEDGHWLAGMGPDGTPAVTYDPPMGWSFPLAVGKSFNMNSRVTNAKGAVTEVTASCTIEAWEKVEVRAGSFDAYRIACKNNLGEDGIYWTSPSVGAFVKTRLQRPASHPAGAGTQESELVVRPQ